MRGFFCCRQMVMGSVCGRRRGRGCNLDAHAVELGAGLFGFRRLRMALDQLAKLVDSRILLVRLQQCCPFAKLRGGGFGAPREAFQDSVVGLDRVGVIQLAKGDFAQVELCRSGKFIHGVEVQNVLKFAGGNGVMSGVVVAQARLICLLEWRGHAGSGTSRRRRPSARTLRRIGVGSLA